MSDVWPKWSDKLVQRKSEVLAQIFNKFKLFLKSAYVNYRYLHFRRWIQENFQQSK